MTIDMLNRYIVVDIMEAAENLTEQEIEILQGLSKRNSILSKKQDKYIVISQNKFPQTYKQLEQIINTNNNTTKT